MRDSLREVFSVLKLLVINRILGNFPKFFEKIEEKVSILNCFKTERKDIGRTFFSFCRCLLVSFCGERFRMIDRVSSEVSCAERF